MSSRAAEPLLDELSAPDPLFPSPVDVRDTASPRQLAEAVLREIVPVVSESLGRDTSECIDLVTRVAGNPKANGDELRASLLTDAKRQEHHGWFAPPAHIVCCIACAYAGQALRSSTELEAWAHAVNANAHMGMAFGLLNRQLESGGQTAWSQQEAAIWKAAAEAALPHVGKVQENSRRAIQARYERERKDPSSKQFAKRVAYEAYLPWAHDPSLYPSIQSFVDALRAEYPNLNASDDTIRTRWIPTWRKDPSKRP